ncbi:uncharacterized protein LOC125086743 [Lutra lutra]|uniref:uncharacterized protein LOC125086743 n=1 Tax=Lutra lutra TaxID=9657 RepID=UPI001FD04417|nr:uncharacterized protein LOC125086743 [Lutra lutra]
MSEWRGAKWTNGWASSAGGDPGPEGWISQGRVQPSVKASCQPLGLPTRVNGDRRRQALRRAWPGGHGEAFEAGAQTASPRPGRGGVRTVSAESGEETAESLVMNAMNVLQRHGFPVGLEAREPAMGKERRFRGHRGRGERKAQKTLSLRLPPVQRTSQGPQLTCCSSRRGWPPVMSHRTHFSEGLPSEGHIGFDKTRRRPTNAQVVGLLAPRRHGKPETSQLKIIGATLGPRLLVACLEGQESLRNVSALLRVTGAPLGASRQPPTLLASAAVTVGLLGQNRRPCSGGFLTPHSQAHLALLRLSAVMGIQAWRKGEAALHQLLAGREQPVCPIRTCYSY